MRLVVLDSTAVVDHGPGSAAYFSRYAIEHLRARGHEVTIVNGFDARRCAEADAVWTEWANDDAFEAAGAGVCKRLVVRLRGIDAFCALDKLEWSNVDALVYESPFLKQLVEERFPGLRGFRTHVIPSGVDVANIPFRERGPGPVVAMVGRGVADKGFQLAFEWARQRPDIQLHVGIALAEPRLLRYLEYSKPDNVTIHHSVKTVEWLDKIDANYLLSASNWESLGYTIAEAMAMGIKPLVHDTPGAKQNWPTLNLWSEFSVLNGLAPRPLDRPAFFFDSIANRLFIESELDAAKQSAKFAELLLGPAVRTTSLTQRVEGSSQIISQIEYALQANQLDVVAERLLDFRARAPRLTGLDDHRAGLALRLAAAFYEGGDLDHARVWALRSLGDIVRADTLCLLGEIAAAENDLESARAWYSSATGVRDVPTRYPSSGLAGVVQIHQRWKELFAQLNPDLPPGEKPENYLIVVAVRNAEKYIGPCLESIKQQAREFRCVVIDDASTDGTADALVAAVNAKTLDKRFMTVLRTSRNYSLPNIVKAIDEFGSPNDVVVIVDGDDQLMPDALHMLDGAYLSGAWMTYGNFVTSSGRASWMPPYPHRVVQANAFRSWPWSVSHPKTFKKALFDKIDRGAFLHDDQWFHTAGDVALMMPMLEMAAERAVYIAQPLYVWNDTNPESDHRVDPDGQVRVRNLILAKQKYERLEKLEEPQ